MGNEHDEDKSHPLLILTTIAEGTAHPNYMNVYLSQWGLAFHLCVIVVGHRRAAAMLDLF